MKKPKLIGIVTKHLGSDVVSLARDVKKYLENKGASVCIERSLSEKVLSKDVFDLGKAPCDFMIVIGGDGTILATEQALSGRKVPLLGINKGAKGFLTELERKDFKKGLDLVLKGEYTVEKRTKLSITLNGQYLGDILNDAVVTSAIPGKIQRYKVVINGAELDEIAADGIILATPNGSTAYAMSAGGPILDPGLDAFELVPICPFRLSSRAIVLPPDSELEARVSTERGAVLVLDGYERHDISKKDSLKVKKSRDSAYFVKFEHNFYEKVRRKLA